MGVRRKFAIGGLAAGLPLLGVGAGTAGAVERSRDITFPFNGQEVTCTVAGLGNSSFIEDSGYTSIVGSTSLDDDDPACHQAIVEIYVNASYRRQPGDEPDHASAGLANEEEVRLDVLAHGTMSEVVVSHIAVFLCDDPGPTCQLSFTTYHTK